MDVIHSSIPHVARFVIRAALAQFSIATTFSAEPSPSAALEAAPKTHVLFMGADIEVEKDKEFYPVQDVTPSSLVIELNGKPAQVPQSRDVVLLIKESLKLAAATVVVENLVTERAYAPGSDPFRQVAQSVAFAAGESAVSDLAQGEVMQANAAVMGANVVLDSLRGTDIEHQGAAAVAQAEAMQAGAEANVANHYNTPDIQSANVSSMAAEAGAQASQHLYDAIRLSFELRSDTDLDQPYYAVVAHIFGPDSKPGHVRKWVYVKTLGAMKAGETKRVSVFQSGMPTGYAIESCEVHLYDHGGELATNLSRKRVELTDEETLDYRIIEYVGANKGRTLPAVIARATLDNEIRATLTPAQLDESAYVRVAKDGRVTAVYRDAEGNTRLTEPALEAAFSSIRFKPALEAGKPVESVVAIKISELASS
jgi:hypothetical protein